MANFRRMLWGNYGGLILLLIDTCGWNNQENKNKWILAFKDLRQETAFPLCLDFRFLRGHSWNLLEIEVFHPSCESWKNQVNYLQSNKLKAFNKYSFFFPGSTAFEVDSTPMDNGAIFGRWRRESLIKRNDCCKICWMNMVSFTLSPWKMVRCNPIQSSVSLWFFIILNHLHWGMLNGKLITFESHHFCKWLWISLPVFSTLPKLLDNSLSEELIPLLRFQPTQFHQVSLRPNCSRFPMSRFALIFKMSKL